MKASFNTCADLYEEINIAKKRFLDDEMPCIDFSLPKHDFMEKSKRPMRIFRTVVQRVMRINQNLDKFADAFEIIESLKKVKLVFAFA